MSTATPTLDSAQDLSSRRSPYLSIVACSRNDGHGENLIERMQLFVDGIADQAERFRLDCELILVDWNPPEGRPGLAEVLRYPEAGGFLTSRVVVVPPEVHAELPHAEALPLYQMIAKNVGIRRARGRMVLSTNVDILFPDALIAWLARGELDEDALYRTDRADICVPFQVSEVVDPATARGLRPLRVNRRNGTHDADGHRVIPIYTSPLDLARYQGGRLLSRKRGRELRPGKPGAASSTQKLRVLRIAGKVARTFTVSKPHLNACGDFTLLSRDNWLRIGGHAEWPIYSWNLDALLLYQARAHGIGEIDLPRPFTVLHMDHSKGSGWTPEGAVDLFARMSARGIPVLTDDGLMGEVRRLGLGPMRRARPRQFSPETWGYAGLTLDQRTFPETAPSRRERA
jgi:hypothetical protein